MRMCGYARVSTDEEKQLDSLEHQTEFFSAFAESHGHHLVHVYADEGITGRQLKKRDAFNKMLSDSKLGLFDLLVVKDVSRFARNTVDLLTSVRRLKSQGIEILFVNNSQKVLGESEFIITLLGAMAQEESANLSKRVKFGKNINSQKGRVPPRIFGYDRIDNFTLQINEDEADTVREIYHLYIDAGYGCHLIAQKLENEGRLTKFGYAWNQRNVRRVLTNPIYCGHYVNHKYTVPDFLDGSVKPLPEAEHYHHERPEWAIIPPERYQQAQNILEQRRIQYESKYVHRTGRYSGRHLFSTLIRCAECGRAFSRRVVHYPNSDYIYWRCPTNNEYTAKRCPNNTIVREDTLIQTLSDYLRTLIADKDTLTQTIVQQYGSQLSQGDQVIDTRALESKKDKLQKKLEKYMDMYANDVISMDVLKDKTSSIKESIESINDQLIAARGQGQQAMTIDEMVQKVCNTIENFLSLDSATNQDLCQIVDVISVTKDKHITIKLKSLQ